MDNSRAPDDRGARRTAFLGLEAADTGHLSANAGADATRSRTGWLGEPQGVPDSPATGRLSLDRFGRFISGAYARAPGVGAIASWGCAIGTRCVQVAVAQLAFVA